MHMNNRFHSVMPKKIVCLPSMKDPKIQRSQVTFFFLNFHSLFSTLYNFILLLFLFPKSAETFFENHFVYFQAQFNIFNHVA